LKNELQLQNTAYYVLFPLLKSLSLLRAEKMNM